MSDESIHLISAEIIPVALPMKKPFVTGFGSISKKRAVLLKLTDKSRLEGWSEVATLEWPIYNHETTDMVIEVLRKHILPAVIGKKFDNITELNMALDWIKGWHLAKAGLDNAAWDIVSQIKSKPIFRLLGGKRKKIPVGESIGIKTTIKETLTEIEKRLSMGFLRIKVKIRPGWDVKIIKEVRKIHPNIKLMVDANSSYRVNDIDIFRKLDEFGLTMIEQPLGDEDIIDHAELQRQIRTNLCLDESITSYDKARKAIAIEACRVINIKQARCGGLTEALKIHNLSRDHDIGVWCGGMLETDIGKVFNHAIASLKNFSYPADSSPTEFYYKDILVTEPFEVDPDGYARVFDDIGVKNLIDMKKIQKYSEGCITVS